jgi:hypothetical protein
MAASASSAETSKPSEVPRLSLTASLLAFKTWRTRLTAYFARTKPELAVYMSDSARDKAPSKEINTAFASHLLQYLDDDVLQQFEPQFQPSELFSVGVDLFRAIVDHFAASAPPEETAEELFLRSFPQLVRDKFPTLDAYMRASLNFLQTIERTSRAKAPNVERILIIGMHTLHQLCQGNYCPWAHAIKAKYLVAAREHTDLAGVFRPFHELVAEVSTFTSAKDAQSDKRSYDRRPQCTVCKRFGHLADRCRVGKPRTAAPASGQGRVNNVAAASDYYRDGDHAAERPDDSI